MRTMTAFFAGVGTVAVALAAGLGGGLLFSNIVAPHQPKYVAEPTKLEQRMADRTIAMTSSPSEPAPYLAATQPATTVPVVVAAPQTQPQVQTEAPAAAPLPVERQANNAAAPPPAASTPPAATPSPASTDPTTREPAASPREAFAKARDADVKRVATEKRRADRRQQWADKRRDRQPRERELEAVEQSVRDATEPRQAFMAEPARLDTPRRDVPRIRLFGDD
jgi:hypothetical protein